MSASNGFLGSTSPATADQLQLWAGDQTQGAQGFTGLFLLDGGTDGTRHWAETADSNLESQDHVELFPADRAFFLNATGEDHPNYRVSAPETWSSQLEN